MRISHHSGIFQEPKCTNTRSKIFFNEDRKRDLYKDQITKDMFFNETVYNNDERCISLVTSPRCVQSVLHKLMC